MKLISIAALAVALSAVAGSAQAAWQTSVEGDETYYVAWVNDRDDTNQLSIDCDTEWMENSVAIISNKVWDSSADYPKSVPVTFSIDGVPFASTDFVVEKAGSNIAIAAYEWDAPQVWELIATIGLAEQDIQATFLDQELHFPVDKVFESAAHVQVACLF